MKAFLSLALLWWCISTTAVAEAEGPVLKIRVLQQRVCLIGKDCQPVEVACGSAVVVDHATGKKTGAKGYALLTAAHVVTIRENKAPHGKWVWYPTDFWFEVLIGGEWKPAKLHFTSKNADLALLTVGSPAVVEMVCLGQERPKKGQPVSITGWTECTNLDSYNAKVEIWDEGPNCSDSFHNATGPVVSGQSGGAVLDKNGDLIGILTARDSTNNRSGIYTHHSEIVRFMKAAWNPEIGAEPEIDSKAPSIAPEAIEPKDVPKVIPAPEKPPEGKPSGLGGIWEGAGEEPLPEPAPLPKEEPKNLLPLPPKLPDLPEIIGGMRGKAPVADAIVKAEPFFKLGGLALTGLQLAGIAVPGVGLPVAGAASVIMWLARKRKAQVENGNGVPSVNITTGSRGSWFGYADPREGPPEPPPNPPGPPDRMPDWLKDWTSQITRPTVPVVTNEHPEPSRPGGAGTAEPPRIPFPRKLGPAMQSLELGKLEGRIPVADQYAGMIFEDELRRMLDAEVDEGRRDVLVQLKRIMDRRLAEEMPLTTKVE